MSQIILDIGSGKSLPDFETAHRFIDEIKAIDTHKHEVVFKAQLFKSAPPNTPLHWTVFDDLYHYAKKAGYKLTSSVFDRESLAFLLRYDIPFVKIACRPDLYWLIGEVPRKITVYVSYESGRGWPHEYSDMEFLECVPQYPADIDHYEQEYQEVHCVSDHASGLELWNKYPMLIWEKHLCLERSPDNPDSGPFAVTPEDLRGIL